MDPLLPNTPYFRNSLRVVFDDIIELSFSTAGKNDKIDFTQPTSVRNHRIHVQNEVFYVSLDEITVASPILGHLLADKVLSLDDVSSNDFKVLLHYICPIGREEVRTETVRPLLSLAIKWNIAVIINECRKFICSHQIKKLPVLTIVEIYSLLGDDDKEEDDRGRRAFPMRRSILKTLLEMEDHAELFSLMLTGTSSSCFSILKTALKSVKDVQHSIFFVNCSSPVRCRCVAQLNKGRRLFERKISRVTSPSLCGLFCSTCNASCCVECQKEICAVKLDALVESQLEAEKKAMEEREVCSPPLEEDILEDTEESPRSVEMCPREEKIPCKQAPVQYSKLLYPERYCPPSYSQRQYYQPATPVEQAISPSFSHYSTPYPVPYSYCPQPYYPPVYRPYSMSPSMSCTSAYPSLAPPPSYQYITQYVHFT